MHICECKDLMKRENENSHAARVWRNGERVQKYLALKTAEKTVPNHKNQEALR